MNNNQDTQPQQMQQPNNIGSSHTQHTDTNIHQTPPAISAATEAYAKRNILTPTQPPTTHPTETNAQICTHGHTQRNPTHIHRAHNTHELYHHHAFSPPNISFYPLAAWLAGACEGCDLGNATNAPVDLNHR